jgi:AraC-like DNA-binding protein
MLSTERLFERRVRELGARRPASKLRFAGEGVQTHFASYSPYTFDPHVAGRHEFVFAVSGRARISTPREDFAIEAGDLLLIAPGVDHGEMPAEQPSSYVLCWCVLDQSYAMLLHTTYSVGTSWTLGGPHLELHGRTNVQSIAIAVGVELTNRAWGWQAAAQSLLRYLSCVLVRRIRRGYGSQLAPVESPTVAHDPAAWEVVQNALQHCRANSHRRLRVADVARAVGYSSSRLSHLFSAYIGQSVADHVRSLRMARARDLLETTDLTVSEVARRVGYGDPAHFSRAFKRSERVSPNAFRQRLRGQ